MGGKNLKLRVRGKELKRRKKNGGKLHKKTEKKALKMNLFGYELQKFSQRPPCRREGLRNVIEIHNIYSSTPPHYIPYSPKCVQRQHSSTLQECCTVRETFSSETDAWPGVRTHSPTAEHTVSSSIY